jgi:hypothetical protein
MSKTRLLLPILAALLASPFGSASAQTADAEPSAAAGPTVTRPNLRPVPTLRCTFTQANACAPGKACTDGKIDGLSLPMKVTADFEAGVVASIDDKGFARADAIDQAVASAGQLILLGVDGAYGWLLIIHDNSEAASVTFQTADTTLTAYGTCAK